MDKFNRTTKYGLATHALILQGICFIHSCVNRSLSESRREVMIHHWVQVCVCKDVNIPIVRDSESGVCVAMPCVSANWDADSSLAKSKEVISRGSTHTALEPRV